MEGGKKLGEDLGRGEQWEASVACWDKNPSGYNCVGVTHVILSAV